MSFIYEVDPESLPPVPREMSYFTTNARASFVLRQARYLGARAGAPDAQEALDIIELGRACLDVGFAGNECGFRHGEVQKAFEVGLRDAADAAMIVQAGADAPCTLAAYIAKRPDLSAEEARDLRDLATGRTYRGRQDDGAPCKVTRVA